MTLRWDAGRLHSKPSHGLSTRGESIRSIALRKDSARATSARRELRECPATLSFRGPPHHRCHHGHAADSEVRYPKGKLPAVAGPSITRWGSQSQQNEWDAGGRARESQGRTGVGT